MIECQSCHNEVRPTKKTTGWILVLLLLFFWPGALLYVLTRAANTCPVCGARIQRPQITLPAPPALESAASSGQPRRVLRRWSQLTRGQKVFAVGGAAVGLLVLIIAISVVNPEKPSEEREIGRTQAPFNPTARAQNTMIAIANDAGAFVSWYIDTVTPVCEEAYGVECHPIVYELTKAEPCGLAPAGGVDWPAELPDGKFYLVEMIGIGGYAASYRQISSGSRHREVPTQQEIFDCWDDLGIIR